MRGNWRGRRGLVALGGLLLISSTAVKPAEAHNDGHSWTNCSYTDLTDRSYDVTVSNDPNYPFPPPAVHDGVLNSFPARLGDAVNRWGAEMFRYTGGMFVIEPPSTTSDVVVRYTNFVTGNGAIQGDATPISIGGSPCVIHGGTDLFILRTVIRIDVRTDWFTQADSRRSFWEGCDDRGDFTSYTCSKTKDFGSAIAHELGHAQALVHPEHVDQHLGSGTLIATGANCGNGVLYSTMCARLPDGYWFAGRTLDVWDQNATRRHYEENDWP